jgi:hypothetical protein
MTAIEIAVPAGAQAQVQRAIGQRMKVRMVNLDEAERAQLFVSTLSAIPTQSALRQVLKIELKIIIFVGAKWGSVVSATPLQRLLQLGRMAPVTVEPFLAPDADSLQRVLLAKMHNAEDKLIAAASLDGDELVVWSCEPREFRCRIVAIPALRGLSKSKVSKFSVSSSGSRLRWPDEDIDLNLETFRELSDPEVLHENQERFRREAKHFAEAIKTLRKSSGLNQNQIPGLSERQVRRLESGEGYPHSSTLEKLAVAHDVSPPEYVRQLVALATKGM